MSKYQLRQTLHRAPLAVAVGSAMVAGGAQAGDGLEPNIIVTTNFDGPLGFILDDCTLRAAIASVNTGTDVDGCTGVQDGANFIGFDESLEGSTISVGSELLIDLPESAPFLDIRGSGSSASAIRLDAGGTSRVFNIQDAALVGLKYMTLEHGATTANNAHGGAVVAYGVDLALDRVLVQSSSTSGTAAYGGGIHVSGGQLTMRNSVLSGNATHGYLSRGGGASVTGGEVTIETSSIVGNYTTGHLAQGGGASFTGGDVTVTDLVLRDNVTEGNAASGGGLSIAYGDLSMTGGWVYNNWTASQFSNGGAIDIRSGDAHIENALIQSNRTRGENSAGGGLALIDGDLSLHNSSISGNTTDLAGAHGGGVFMAGGAGASLDISSSVIHGNRAQGGFISLAAAGGCCGARGGGLYMRNVEGASAYIRSSRLSGNVAPYGGGVFVNNAGAGSYAVLTETLLHSNGAFVEGGGMYAQGEEVALFNSTISGNQAGFGGGLTLNHGSAILRHSTVAFNTPGRYAIDNVQSGLTLHNSLIVHTGDGGACGLSADDHVNTLATDDSCTGQAIDAALLNIGPLGDNLGFTGTHALGAGSIAIDAAGDCAADFGIDTDQRGQPRPGGDSSACDIGAFELQGDGDGVGDAIFLDRFEE